MPGRPVTFANAQKATIAITVSAGASGFACVVSSTEPAGGGVTAIVGVTSTSKSSTNGAIRSRLMRSSCFIAKT